MRSRPDWPISFPKNVVLTSESEEEWTPWRVICICMNMLIQTFQVRNTDHKVAPEVKILLERSFPGIIQDWSLASEFIKKPGIYTTHLRQWY
jgi:hypothetical protein